MPRAAHPGHQVLSSSSDVPESQWPWGSPWPVADWKPASLLRQICACNERAWEEACAWAPESGRLSEGPVLPRASPAFQDGRPPVPGRGWAHGAPSAAVCLSSPLSSAQPCLLGEPRAAFLATWSQVCPEENLREGSPTPGSPRGVLFPEKLHRRLGCLRIKCLCFERHCLGSGEAAQGIVYVTRSDIQDSGGTPTGTSPGASG